MRQPSQHYRLKWLNKNRQLIGQEVIEEEVQPHAVDDEQQPSEETYQGFVAHVGNQFTVYDFDGNPLGIQYPAGEQGYYGENEVSILPDAIYYSDFGENSGVFRVDVTGTVPVDFININNDPISISVSPDGSKIAWSSSEWVDSAPETRLFIANPDGSNQQLVSEITAGEQEEFWRVYYPVRWTEDGTLLYATGLTGIGGYLLFWGYNGMYEYDPATGWIQTLVSDQERLGLCLSSVSHNREMAAIVCGDGDAVVRIRQLGSGIETAFPILEGQNLAGSAKFSTDDTWLAYVVQTQNFEDERGKVVVVPVDGSQEPRVVSSFNGGAFTVEGWLDADRFLVTRNDMASNNSSIWIMSKDGGLVQELVSGNFVGFMP